RKRRSKLLILVLCLNFPSEVELCPGACVCYSEPKITISCQQQGLGTIPIEIPVQTQRIFLHNNRIGLIQSTSFTFCRNISILWIHSNNISLIEPGAFYGLNKLEELDLSDNVNLKSINPSTFQGLVHLHTLHLDRCGILELSTGLFRGLFSLQYLYLQDNNLQELPDDTFLDLANLTYLFLHGNKIKRLSENVFRGLTNLDRLLLHQNRVGGVHRRAFHDLGKVMTLYLFNNNLTVLSGETMAPLGSLQYLRLNGNQWVCDCQARSLWDWFKQFKGSSSELECHLPTQLAGRDLKRLPSTDLEVCLDSFNQIQTTAKAGPSSHSNRASPNNPLKDKENMAKTKHQVEAELPKNGSSKHINDSPFGTYPSAVDPPLTNLKSEFLGPVEPSTAPTKRRQGCSRRNKSRSQCRMAQPVPSAGPSFPALPSLLLPPVMWSLFCFS
uniref:Reticulon 4 receptor n=1 Tax=Pseudonaja textilis TaxID=8673 RepID=A0A670Z573_PSETE